MNRYNNTIIYEKVSEPIMSSQLPKKRINFSAISKYAKEHNICVAELSKEEKDKLVKSVILHFHAPYQHPHQQSNKNSKSKFYIAISENIFRIMEYKTFKMIF